MTQALLFPQDNLLFFSAADSQKLTEQVQAWLAQYPWKQDMLVWQNCSVEQQAKCRLFVIADNMDLLQQRLEQALVSLQRGVRREGRIGKGIFYSSDCSLKQGGIAFVFPGQGCQYPGMGQSLAKRYPSVAAWIQGLDEALLEVAGEKVSSYYYQGKYAQEMHPKLFDLDVGACIVNTLSLAYHELVVQLGIKPEIYVGHSTGEFTALMASGRLQDALTAQDFMQIQSSFVEIYQLVMKEHKVPEGTLFSVGMLDREKIEACFPASAKHIYIALDNCPNQKIVFCPYDEAESLRGKLQQAGGMVDSLPFAYAYHTPLFSEVSQALSPFYEGLKFSDAKVKLYSCITANMFPDNNVEAKVLAMNLLQKEVFFQGTIEKLYDLEHIRLFIEVGPRNNISSFMNDTLQGKEAQVVSTGLANVGEVEAFLQMLGQLFIAGKLDDTSKLYEQKSSQEPLLSREETVEKLVQQPAEQAMLMQVHFDLMQTFLEQQTRVMNLINQYVESSMTQQEEHTVSQCLLGELISKDVKKACWTREVSLEKEPYLLDHAFGGKASLKDTNKTALPVIPFTFSMETTVQAAVSLAGKACTVQRVFDVRALRWITYLRKPLKLEIQAQFLSETVLLCQIFNISGGQKILSFESKVEIALVKPLTLLSSGYRPSNEIVHSYHQGNFYIGEMPTKPWVPAEFHGASFQAVERITHMGKDGVSAVMRVLPRHNLFSNEAAPKFMIDPIMIDASMHLTAYWIHSKYGVDLTILPFQIESYQYVSEPLAAGEKVIVHVKNSYVQSDGTDVPHDAGYHFFDYQGQLITKHLLEEENRRHAPKGVSYHKLYPETLAIRSDIEYFDQEGNLLAVLKGRLDKHFSIPTVYNRFTDYPAWNLLAYQDGEQFRLDEFEAEFLLSSGKIWLYKLAWLVLTEQEWIAWFELDERDSLNMLYQTIVCKDLVRNHLLNTCELRYAPADLICKRVDKSLRPEHTLWLCSIVDEASVVAPLHVEVSFHDSHYMAAFIKA